MSKILAFLRRLVRPLPRTTARQRASDLAYAELGPDFRIAAPRH